MTKGQRKEYQKIILIGKQKLQHSDSLFCTENEKFARANKTRTLVKGS